MEIKVTVIKRMIGQFETDIRSGTDNLPTKFERSSARKELLELGRLTLNLIAEHVERKYLDKTLTHADEDVVWAWKDVLYEILTQPPPIDENDLRRWINACRVEAPHT